MNTLMIRPISLRDARAFVLEKHRHNKPPQGHKFSVGAWCGDTLVGVGIAGRPIARALDDGVTLEVIRTCTDGTRNANSLIYGALSRAAKALGYKKILTYTQGDESGASLRAVGWRPAASLKPRAGWDCVSRPRKDIGTAGVERIRWEHTFG